MSYHEPRLSPGDPGAAPLAQVIVFVDDEGKAHYPGSEGYVEPEEGAAEFLADQARQLAEDQHRIESGQAQTFSPDQVEATRAEAERLTDPALEGPSEAVEPSGAQAPAAAPPPPPEDPNAAARDQEIREARARADRAEQEVQATPVPPDPNAAPPAGAAAPAPDPNVPPAPQATRRPRRNQ